MTELRIEVDARKFDAVRDALARLPEQAPVALALAVNHTGAKATTQVKRALVKQTGAKYRTITAQLTTVNASAGRLVYRIRGRGLATSLKDFGARQTARGVSAAPWAKRRVFPHSFGPGIAKLGGHVFVRASKRRLPLKKLWGPIIPYEMVKGESRTAFERAVASDLPSRLAHELGRLLPGR